MAYSSVAIAGDELTALNLDRPMLVGSHLMRDEFDPDTTGNVWTKVGSTTSADETLAGYPAYRAWDGHAYTGLYTTPDSNSTEWFYTLALAGTADFDVVCLWGENLDTATRVKLEIADDADFLTNLLVVVNASPATRLTQVLASRYSGVQYARLRISSGGGGIAPRLNEVWIGRRRQLLEHVDLPWGDKHEQSKVRTRESSVGVSPPRTLHRGAAVRSARIAMADATAYAVLSGWHADTDLAARSFLWIETPSTSPTTHLMTFDASDADYRAQRSGPYRRDLSLPMREIDPFASQAY